jgi:Tol biopolymer transport system component
MTWCARAAVLLVAALLPAAAADATFPGASRELVAAGEAPCFEKDCSMDVTEPGGPFVQVINPRTRVTRFLSYCSQYVCSAPTWSADGRLLAVSAGTGSTTWPDGGLRTVAQLAILDPAGALVRLLPLQTGSDEAPAWSPDGSQLAFVGLVSVTPSGDRHELYTVNADGTGLARRSAAGQDVRQVAWSSAGQLAFTSWGRRSGIYLTRPNGPPRRIIRRARSFDWSPDGTRIVATDRPRLGVGGEQGVSGETALAIFDRRGSRTRSLTMTGRPIGKTGQRVANVDAPAWSPDGRRIAFVTRAAGEAVTWVVAADVSDGGGVRRILGGTPNRGNLLYHAPAWRPAPRPR